MSSEGRRTVIGIDPGDSSGVAVWALDADGGARLVETWPASLRGMSATWAAASMLGSTLDGSAGWVAAVERPFNRRGPVHGERSWRDLLEELARQRAQGRPYRKPTVLRPYPQTWRKALGLPTRGGVKLETWARMRQAHALDLHATPDEADACAIGLWACYAVALAEKMKARTIPVGRRAVPWRWVP